MGVSFDGSQMIDLSARIRSNGARVGAAGSKVLRKTAFDIEADAKILAPVDTGNLMNSISTVVTGDGRFGEMEAVITAEADYAAYVEFGTSTQPGQPFMVPAFERRVPGFQAALAALGESLLD